MNRRPNPVWSGVALSFRFLRLVVMMSLVVVIFWRGVLARGLSAEGRLPVHELPTGCGDLMISGDRPGHFLNR